MTTICVDAMGGDEEPRVVLEGIGKALEADGDLSVLVVGDEDVVVPFAASHERVRALVSTEVIGMDEHPADAVRAKRDSSIVRGCASVRAGGADGFFSAGSTGAIFAAATLHIGRVKGIKRPSIASSLPGMTGRETVLTDMGANADARPDMLVQFAQMGRAYARVALGVAEPTVALLSNGSEDTKGSEAVLAAHKALAEAGPDWFRGNCEGTDVLAGRYDVIVTDGFTGNVALKSLEGTAKFILSEVKRSVASSGRSKLGALLLKPALKAVAASLSGDEKGGAVLLGVKAPVLIGHGATSADAVMNGTLACARAVRAGLVDNVARLVQQGQ
ncbi:phosphate acyltransferase PlsX [Olsenella sp. DNF00959]|uniref:phosphate acyltransferase PlsX n=1 Tax=Olsenella sp. DNF00959 TaxID=1476999 RepID=UPI000783E0D2|nr:phosphate acyltransferase PlsX [Olsenella sp. DNF00959]KXB62475.1 fatty acid/phospholipid synthesis protein PlsX [Olsenella sp. DNF00959]